ncbi:OmpA family protein [Pendulispora rubella]|uniref:OmpA family protein n=1 Tax=Pendulispora rubella TaxID=2741070 RepID=A0ABZ2LNL7_9BACT
MQEQKRNSQVVPARRLRRFANDRDDLEDLRRILMGPDRARLEKLEGHMSPDALGKALPEAAVASQKQGEDLAWALRPTVMAAIRDAVKTEPQIFIDALVPVMGPAIRKAVTHALRSLLQQLNETLAHGLSLRGLRWRVEAARTGRPFAEIVVLRSLLYRVEQVFLVHRESGLVLHHLVAPGSPPQDPDQVAAMLSAIDAFVHDAFREDARLARFHVGELVGWVEHGPMAVLVAVVRGTAPDHYGDVMREVQERIHLQFRSDLSSFRGEVELFEQTESLLQQCLQSEMRPAANPRRSRAYSLVALALVAVVIGLGIAWKTHVNHVEEARFQSVATTLRQEPGLMLTDARRDGKHYAFAGLRDPLAPEPASLVAPLGMKSGDASFDFGAFYSLDPRLTERRAIRVLQPPDGVTLAVDGETLVARGSAPRAWIDTSRVLALALPAVSRFDTSALRNTDAERDFEGASETLTSSMVLFPLGSAEIRPEQRSALEHVARAAAKLFAVSRETGKTVNLVVTGHTDARGAEGLNQSLSSERADRVVREFVALGVPAENIRTVGAGVTMVPDSEACAPPAVSIGTYRGASCARRVDFRVELR